MSESGHFETKSGAFSTRVYRSGPLVGADVLAPSASNVRPHRHSSRRHHVEHVAERWQAKRNSLADELAVEAKALADLQVEKATIDGERRTVEADLGSARYLATLIGADNEMVLRWFILVVALLLDPAAVLLLLAATRTRHVVN
jgi:hypothetical protein